MKQSAHRRTRSTYSDRVQFSLAILMGLMTVACGVAASPKVAALCVMLFPAFFAVVVGCILLVWGAVAAYHRLLEFLDG